MLLNLYVKNMALIEEADISFTQGLNILTGETGAGKSIIIGSVNIALGNKVSTDVIRKGAEYALVELTFRLNSPEKIQALKDMDIEDLDDGEVIITRKISEGRSPIKVNGITVTVSQMKKIASYLIDIHGQHEHQSLLNDGKHLEIIDIFSMSEGSVLKEKLKTIYHEYSDIKHRLESMSSDEESRQRELSFMQFEIDEITKANLNIGEDDELEQKFRKMSNAQKIAEEIGLADQLISGGYENASELIGRAAKAVHQAATYDDGLFGVNETLSNIESMLFDAARELSNYMDDCEFKEEEFIEVQNRLNVINSLKMKYGQSIKEILDYAEEKSSKLEEYQNFDEVKLAYEKQFAEKEKELIALCDELTKVRQSAAQKLSADIKQALVDLNFLEVRFETEFEKLNNYSANGNDSVRFLISTNPGEDLKPLSKIASGGETSRIMLAIKAVLADRDDMESLIFDEIDTGISGRTAQMTADKLDNIAKNHQIICITHLPQIASMADTHFVIEKSTKEDRTITDIKKLSYEDSVTELARLLGGTRITDTVISNAREMKELAKK